MDKWIPLCSGDFMLNDDPLEEEPEIVGLPAYGRGLDRPTLDELSLKIPSVFWESTTTAHIVPQHVPVARRLGKGRGKVLSVSSLSEDSLVADRIIAADGEISLQGSVPRGLNDLSFSSGVDSPQRPAASKGRGNAPKSDSSEVRQRTEAARPGGLRRNLSGSSEDSGSSGQPRPFSPLDTELSRRLPNSEDQLHGHWIKKRGAIPSRLLNDLSGSSDGSVSPLRPPSSPSLAGSETEMNFSPDRPEVTSGQTERSISHEENFPPAASSSQPAGLEVAEPSVRQRQRTISHEENVPQHSSSSHPGLEEPVNFLGVEEVVMRQKEDEVVEGAVGETVERNVSPDDNLPAGDVEEEVGEDAGEMERCGDCDRQEGSQTDVVKHEAAAAEAAAADTKVKTSRPKKRARVRKKSKDKESELSKIRGQHILQLEHLPPDVSHTSISELLSSFGTVLDTAMASAGTARVARVSMDSAGSCDWAKECLDGTCAFSDDSCITVTIVKD